MKRLKTSTRHRNVVGSILMLLLIASCTTPVGPVAMSSATPVDTVIVPSLTMTPSPAPVVNTPTSTPTPLATLTAEQEKAYVLDMLKTNGACELPCWWGITPNETTLPTLRDRFGFHGTGSLLQDGTVLYEAHYDLGNSAGGGRYSIALGFGERDGIVDEIGVTAEVNAETQPRQFAQDWQRYSIDQVLARSGMPARVQVQLVPPTEPGAPPSYAMTLVYEKYGFWIRYEGPATYDTKKAIVHACPTLAEVTRIQLRLRSPTASTRTPLFQPDPNGFDKSLEEATGMSLKAFHENFKDTSKQTCLEGIPTSP